MITGVSEGWLVMVVGVRRSGDRLHQAGEARPHHAPASRPAPRGGGRAGRGAVQGRGRLAAFATVGLDGQRELGRTQWTRRPLKAWTVWCCDGQATGALGAGIPKDWAG